ncbi:MAG TPA: 3-phosphoshikimate 1-carboxyvinyltransferase [Candidatus Saccharimonadales bacterium]|nr:3-phosphoshikimate 1-carboxyvinyltransferase [Candidatus Saccharimonadales bacterium]
MKTIQMYPLKNAIKTNVSIPGSLSYSIRALVLAAMTKGSVTIANALKSNDTYTMVKVLQTLGIEIEERENAFIVHGDISNIENKEYELNIQISGRTARTMVAFLCIVPGIKTVICDAAFKKRPIGDLVDGLKQLGADITYLKQPDYLPVKISSSTLQEGKIQIKGNISSQYISAIMMIAPLVGAITIEVLGEQASKPFIDVTIDIMKTFGVQVSNANYQRYTIQSEQKYRLDTFFVESDATAASYFWALAAITKSTIKILQMNPESAQGDIRFVDLLEQMGCIVEKNFHEQWISVTGTDALYGISVNMNDIPDVVPTLAVVAAFTRGITYITGLEHLKVKESDRIEAPKNELTKMGIIVESTNTSITITGAHPHGASIETYGDHRIAMAFAIAGAKVDGIEISNPDVVNKSFPKFWEKLQEIGVEINL